MYYENETTTSRDLKWKASNHIRMKIDPDFHPHRSKFNSKELNSTSLVL